MPTQLTPARIQMIKNLPTMQEILLDSSTPEWLRLVLETAMRKDVVDAANCLELASNLMIREADIALRGTSSVFYKPSGEKPTYRCNVHVGCDGTTKSCCPF